MARTTTKITPSAGTSSRSASDKAPMPKTRSNVNPAPVSAPEPVIVDEITPVSDQLEMRKPELIELVVERSGIKKRDAKPVVEAMLEILGETIAEGREANLRPFGKLKIMRMKQLSNARVITCKVRQVQTTDEDLTDPLAEAAE